VKLENAFPRRRRRQKKQQQQQQKTHTGRRLEERHRKKTNHELSPRESVVQGVHESRSTQLLHHPCITVAV
jgi:hypothetical protein